MDDEENGDDFKKPVFVAKAARKTIQLEAEKVEERTSPEDAKKLEQSYKEPSWSGLPSGQYNFEVLKNGSIINSIDLTEKPYWVFGRLPTCDISMAHPTVSRHHAILQYREKVEGDEEKGFYLYDLTSTHGTFLNKVRIKPRVYVRVKVGHIIKLGCSTRNYILGGPDDDAEEVSEFSVTQLKQKRLEELVNRQKEAELKTKKEEVKGVDWGMGEDAEEEDELMENPFAQTNNEELYLDDPKKTLRGFMDREGHSFEYDCTEQGVGQFLCKVVLPLDDPRGRPIVAEVLHKGKKKEAFVQCALEACRILDRHGVLRQATHESRKRKSKNWEENDFYDSDDDTFLDRTGTVEKKRENRMKAKLPQKIETYESLIEKEASMSRRIKEIETELEVVRNAGKAKQQYEDEDSLDSFMKTLKTPQVDKQKISKLKADLLRLKQDHAAVVKLANLAKPADMPALKPQTSMKMPMFGKRTKLAKLSVPAPVPVSDTVETDEIEEEAIEIKSEEKEMKSKDLKSDEGETKITETKPKPIIKQTEDAVAVIENKNQVNEVNEPNEIEKNSEDVKKEEEKRKKKNMRRIQQRAEKMEVEKVKGYEADFSKEDYNMWVPPQNQTGDGRTSLNEKFGY